MGFYYSITRLFLIKLTEILKNKVKLILSRNSFFDPIIRNKNTFTNTVWNQIFLTEGNYFQYGIIISIVHVINLFSLKRVMLWRDKYGSIIKEEAQRPLWQERKGREVKIHQCFSSSLDVAFCFFSPIFLPPFSPILGKAKLFIGLILTLLFLGGKGRPKEREKDGRMTSVWSSQNKFLYGHGLWSPQQLQR